MAALDKSSFLIFKHSTGQREFRSRAPLSSSPRRKLARGNSHLYTLQKRTSSAFHEAWHESGLRALCNRKTKGLGAAGNCPTFARNCPRGNSGAELRDPQFLTLAQARNCPRGNSGAELRDPLFLALAQAINCTRGNSGAELRDPLFLTAPQAFRSETNKAKFGI